MGLAIRRRSGGAVALVAFSALTGCSPPDMGAVTLDEATGRPALVVSLCEDQQVSAVRLIRLIPAEDGGYDEGPTLWRIEAAGEARTRLRYVVGETPPGFEQTVPLEGDDLPNEVALQADLTGTGVRAGGRFVPSELTPGVLLQDGAEVSEGSLEDAANFFNCGLPAWTLWLGGGLALGGLAFIVWQIVKAGRPVVAPAPPVR